jgi:hypothetical protein
MLPQQHPVTVTGNLMLSKLLADTHDCQRLPSQENFRY